MSEISYNWVIRKLECTPSENGLTNVVKTIHWTYQGQEQIEGGKTAEISNQYPLLPPSSENYVNYSDLTESAVIEWLEVILDVNYLRFYIQDKIQKQYEEIIVPPLPWIKEPEVEIVTETIDENIIPDAVIDPPAEELVIDNG